VFERPKQDFSAIKPASLPTQIICATVLAGEISLAAALTSGHLISAHMALNRKPVDVAPPAGVSAGGPERTPNAQSRGNRMRRYGIMCPEPA
jgi:hypothetical protein